MKKETDQKKMVLLIAAIIATSLVLRAPITGVGSLTAMIRSDLMLSNGGAGMLTTIPLLVFAGLSVIMGKFASRWTAGNCLLSCMLILCIGILSRSLLGSGGLYVGTVLIGAGIAGGNVLIPGIVKAYFPDKVGLMTGIYATVMSGMGGISTGISVPIALKFGWRSALLIWLLLTGAALLSWIPNRNCSTEKELRRNSNRRSIASSGMAWAIVFFFGIQSLVFYSFVAWLPTIMMSKGLSEVSAGYFSSVFILIGIPATFLVPIISAREGDECVLNVVIGLMFTIGLILLIIVQHPVLLVSSVVLSGLAVGACFSQSMALFGLRTKDAHDAASLSGLSQSVGYLFAAIGPTCFGWIFDVTDSWLIPLIFMTVVALVETILGYIVGKERIIHGDTC